MVVPMAKDTFRRLGRTRAGWVPLVAGVLLSIALMGAAVPARSEPIPTAVAALSPEEERRSMEIIRTTMSPFCPGRTLDSCPSPDATAWRDDVRAWVARGDSTEDIRNRLAARVDIDLSGAPSTTLDAVMPILVSVTAVLFLALLFRALLAAKRRAEEKNKIQSASASDGELDERLDDELARLDE